MAVRRARESVDRGATSLKQEVHKEGPFDVPEQEAYLNILRTQSVLIAPYNRLFREHGLSEPMYNALRILRGAHRKGTGRTCTEIREHMVTRVPDVTRIVDRLIEHGLAERERSTEDRRVVNVHVTRKGLDVLDRLDAPLVELHRAQLGHLSERELHTLNRLLEKARATSL